jgi:hypothetical protein
MHAFHDLAGALRGRPLAGRAGRRSCVGIHRRSLTPMLFCDTEFPLALDWGGSKPIISPGVNTPWAGAGLPDLQERTAWKEQKERGSNLRWSPSTVRALPGMCPTGVLDAALEGVAPVGELTCCKRARCAR